MQPKWSSGGEEDDLFLLRERVLSSVKKLRHIDLDMLQVEIIDRLIEGRRTATELVIEIYEIEAKNSEYQARYAAVRRGLKGLERRGYTSTNLFGRDRPYRLTRYGVATLCSILPETKKAKILEKWEIAILGSTAIAAAILLLVRHSQGFILFPTFAVFFTLLGLSIPTFAGVLRKVM